MYVRCFWQGKHQTYGHIQCIFTALANSEHTLDTEKAPPLPAADEPAECARLQTCSCPHFLVPRSSSYSDASARSGSTHADLVRICSTRQRQARVCVRAHTQVGAPTLTWSASAAQDRGRHVCVCVCARLRECTSLYASSEGHVHDWSQSSQVHTSCTES